MTDPIFHPRSDWDPNVGPVVGATGARRPALSLEPWMTVHYTGNSATVGTPPHPRYPADMDMRAFLLELQTYAKGAGKPYEYNFVVAPRVDFIEVWEYAGGFQAAHSEGENIDSVGVLLALGTGQAVPQGVIDAVRWLRDVKLRELGLLALDATMLQHRQMPGAATLCPGVSVVSRWAEFQQPYAHNPIEPAPGPGPTPTPPTEDDDMQGVMFQVNDGDPLVMVRFGSRVTSGRTAEILTNGAADHVIVGDLTKPLPKVHRSTLKLLDWYGAPPSYGPEVPAGGGRTLPEHFANGA